MVDLLISDIWQQLAPAALPDISRYPAMWPDMNHLLLVTQDIHL
jgi:hypothetical protein